ncbi:MAG: ATP-binding cassette domain-containing protein [Crocinitomicaceae bacterium]|nr:ATP-binding cassette domain-containing protein [Crocinitomicaceae bacterium]
MKLYLSISEKIYELELSPYEELKLGRNNNLYDFSNTISREHVILRQEDGQLNVKDISTNGCFINGRRVTPNKWIVLNPNQELSLEKNGQIKLSAPPMTKRKVKSDLKDGLKDLFIVKSLVTIGRSSECDIVLSDSLISRKHATVEKIGETYFVTDHSLNGTFINGKRIEKKSRLNLTDTLMIGLYQFSLSKSNQDLSKETAILVKDLSLTFSNGQKGLHPISFTIEKERMVALMGPSGCGKSTLLQLLNGVYTPTQGSVSIFGLPLSTHFELLKQFIGYVPQENIVHEDLTINEALYYTAKLRLGKHVNQNELNERINQVLGTLNINDKELRKQPINKLSGGQKKRVSIAVELLTQPKILFLDEPTSPLDPETIEEFLKSLQQLSKQGTTVIMVTHKPEDLSFMDEVFFMGKGGYLVFQGNQAEITSHFLCERLTQVYQNVSEIGDAKKYYQKLLERSTAVSPGQKPDVKNLEAPTIDLLYQFWWLSLRYAQIKWNNQQNMLIAFLQPIIIAFLVLLVFSDLISENEVGVVVGNIGVLFITALSVIWFGISNSAKEIVSEKAIFNREHLFNLKLLPYLLSKTVVLSLLTMLQTLLFLTIIKWGYPDLNDIGLQFVFVSILGFSAVTFGLLLSSISKTTEAVMSMLPVALIPQIILAGIVQPLESKFTELLSYISLGRWGTEGIARIQDRMESAESMPFMPIIEQNLYPSSDEMEVASISGNMIVLLLLSFIFLVFTYFKMQKVK